MLDADNGGGGAVFQWVVHIVRDRVEGGWFGHTGAVKEATGIELTRNDAWCRASNGRGRAEKGMGGEHDWCHLSRGV